MVAVIDAVGEAVETHGHEIGGMDAALAHEIEKVLADTPAAHVVIDETDLHVSPYGIDERITDKTAHAVVFKNEELQMNVVAGVPDVVDKTADEIIAAEVGADSVLRKGQREIVVFKKIDEREVQTGCLDRAFLSNVFSHEFVGQLVEILLGKGSLAPYVLSEKIVKQQSHDGQEHDYQYPGNRLGGLVIVQKDLYRGTYRNDEIETDDGDDNPEKHALVRFKKQMYEILVVKWHEKAKFQIKNCTFVFNEQKNDAIMPMTLGNSDTLYIRISREKIIFARYDSEQENTLNYHCYAINKNMSLNANMHRVIGLQPQGRGDISHVYVSVDFPVTLVPLNEFDDEEMTRLYTFNIPDPDRRLHVFYDMLPLQNAVMLGAIDKDLEHTILETYPEATFHSAQMPLTLHFASMCRNTAKGGKMFVSYNDKQLTVACFRGNRIVLLNTFENVGSEENAMYYILSMARQWNVDPETDEVYLHIGNGKVRQSLTARLGKYIPNTFPFSPAANINRRVQLLEKDLPYDMIVLILKAY